MKKSLIVFLTFVVLAGCVPQDKTKRGLSPGQAQPGRQIRWTLFCRRSDHGYLLSPHLPRPAGPQEEHSVFSLRRRGGAGRIPSMPPVPSRILSRHPGLGGNYSDRYPGVETDRRRTGRGITGENGEGGNGGGRGGQE